jgi:hypothetical protein
LADRFGHSLPGHWQFERFRHIAGLYRLEQINGERTTIGGTEEGSLCGENGRPFCQLLYKTVQALHEDYGIMYSKNAASQNLQNLV